MSIDDKMPPKDDLSPFMENPIPFEERKKIFQDRKKKSDELDYMLKFAMNDYGHAMRIKHWMVSRLIYCRRRWWMWNGKRWQEDIEGMKTLSMLSSKFNTLRAEAIECNVEKSVDNALSKACNRASIASALEVAKASLYVPDETLDSDPHLLNFENGTVNLLTGELTPPNENHYITKSTGYNYPEIDGECPTFKKLLVDAMGGKEEIAEYLTTLLASSLSGIVKDQIIVFNHGHGSNGKSTLFSHVMLKVTGDYGASVPVNSFLLNKGNSESRPRPDLLALQGVRYGTMSEPPHNATLDESTIKSFTGGDKIVVRDLHKSAMIQFYSNLHLFLSYNPEPTLKDFSLAMKRRIRKIKWEVTFGKDDLFLQRLELETPYIARYLVNRCTQWLKQPLVTPNAIIEATEDYFGEQNPVGLFLKDSATRGSGFSAANTDVWNAWERWANENGFEPFSKSWLGRQLKANGLRQIPSRTHGRRWAGITLQDTSSFD